MFEAYQHQNAFLQRVHPTVKLLSLLIIMLCMIPIYDVWRPLLLLTATVTAIAVLGRVPIQRLLLILLPFLFFGFSFVWLQAVFPEERGETVLFQIGSLPIAAENIEIGLSLGLRALVFASWSLLFVLTTSPTALVLSLMEKWKLTPGIGYGLMAAYRFLPQLHEEFRQIKRAHHMRSMGNKQSVWKWKQYAIPLMAGAIRKAERTAAAMEVKGFDGAGNRTRYQAMPYHKEDIVFMGGVLLTVVSLVWFPI